MDSEKRILFDVFKSRAWHQVKELGDLGYIEELLKSDEIRMYYDKEWYRECFYLLAMLDYLSRLNDVPFCTDYDDIRQYKMEELVYPSDVLLKCAVYRSEAPMAEALRDAIPEFLEYNIVECSPRDAL